MARLLKGAEVAARLNARIKEDADALISEGVVPTLSIIRIGECSDDIAYERNAVKRCEAVGISVRKHTLPADTAQDELLQIIDTVNSDISIHSILLLRPLPGHIDDYLARNALTADKDADGITDTSLAGVFTGNGSGFAPCTPQACMEMLKHYGIELKGKKAVVVGRSLTVGKPLAMLLLAENATVTICHTRTEDMPAVCRDADILIAAAGKAGMIDESCMSPGQIIIDVGINVDEDGKLCGDVKFADADRIVEAVTPVPGGVGTVTTSVLAGNVVAAAKKRKQVVKFDEAR